LVVVLAFDLDVAVLALDFLGVDPTRMSDLRWQLSLEMMIR